MPWKWQGNGIGESWMCRKGQYEYDTSNFNNLRSPNVTHSQSDAMRAMATKKSIQSPSTSLTNSQNTLPQALESSFLLNRKAHLPNPLSI